MTKTPVEIHTQNLDAGNGVPYDASNLVNELYHYLLETKAGDHKEASSESLLWPAR